MNIYYKEYNLGTDYLLLNIMQSKRLSLGIFLSTTAKILISFSIKYKHAAAQNQNISHRYLYNLFLVAQCVSIILITFSVLTLLLNDKFE